MATVYQHFAGRDDVHLAVVERAVAAAQHHLLAAYRAEGPPMDRLIGTATAYLRFHLHSPRLFRMINMRQAGLGIGAPESPVALLLADQVEELIDQLAEVIAEGVADGSVREVDPVATARYLWGAMNGVFGLAVRPDRLRLDTTELLSTVVQGTLILVEGLAGRTIRDAEGRLDPAILGNARTQLTELLDSLPFTERPEGQLRSGAPADGSSV
ncbi:putative transcriptional regulator, TetR family protein [Nocardia neocaledoniensis NBRC 108232]|nr:putative transcriptional regulator, TetR family protein [Nocardia neocaledoniensis NBRC 108232]